MSVPEPSRLQPVELREAWTNESADFTPWLADKENLPLLGEALVIELELDSMDKSVGPFFADILCRVPGSDQWVLIENQLEQTDHTHLGQIITYAAGLNAVTVSPHSSPRYRRACRRLWSLRERSWRGPPRTCRTSGGVRVCRTDRSIRDCGWAPIGT